VIIHVVLLAKLVVTDGNMGGERVAVKVPALPTFEVWRGPRSLQNSPWVNWMPFFAHKQILVNAQKTLSIISIVTVCMYLRARASHHAFSISPSVFHPVLSNPAPGAGPLAVAVTSQRR